MVPLGPIGAPKSVACACLCVGYPHLHRLIQRMNLHLCRAHVAKAAADCSSTKDFVFWVCWVCQAPRGAGELDLPWGRLGCPATPRGAALWYRAPLCARVRLHAKGCITKLAVAGCRTNGKW